MRITRLVVLLPLLLGPFTVSALQPAFTVSSQATVLGSIPQGAQRVPLLQVQLSASCASEVTLMALTLKHSGLGDAKDLLRVYALADQKRVSRAHSVPARDPFTITFPAFTIHRCQSVSLIIAADFSLSAAPGGQHRLTLVSVGSSSPALLTPSGLSTPASITHAITPSVTIDYRPITEEVFTGPHQPILRFLLTGGWTDQSISAITFTNEGSSRDTDLQNLFLETADRRQLTDSAPHLDGRTVRLVFDPPFALARNDASLLTMRADIRASRTHTIQFSIEEPSDIEARR